MNLYGCADVRSEDCTVRGRPNFGLRVLRTDIEDLYALRAI